MMLIAVNLKVIVGAAVIICSSAFQSRLFNFAAQSSRGVQRLQSLSMGQEPWVYDTSPKSAREKAAFRSQVPFSQDIYETLKSSIELLSRRMKIKVEPGKDMSIDEAREAAAGSLTLEEAKWLCDSVEMLIEDAYKYGPPIRPARLPAPSEDGVSESEP